MSEIPITTDDTFEVDIGGRRVRFKHPSLRDVRSLRGVRRELDGLEEVEACERIIGVWGGFCTSHTAEDLAGWRAVDVALIPFAFDTGRTLSDRQRAEVIVAGGFGRVPSAGAAPAAVTTPPVATTP